MLFTSRKYTPSSWECGLWISFTVSFIHTCAYDCVCNGELVESQQGWATTTTTTCRRYHYTVVCSNIALWNSKIKSNSNNNSSSNSNCNAKAVGRSVAWSFSVSSLSTMCVWKILHGNWRKSASIVDLPAHARKIIMSDWVNVVWHGYNVMCVCVCLCCRYRLYVK